MTLLLYIKSSNQTNIQFSSAFYLTMNVSAFVLAAVLLSVVTLCLTEDRYVSAHNGRDCPPDSDCHSLSYYLSDPELYFTSNTMITFLEGTHLLDREEPIEISQVTGLTLIGRGQWVPGQEETIMESTAVIYCTNGSGGFAFYDSSHITITLLSLINCGAFHFDVKVLDKEFYSTFLFSNIDPLYLYNVSIQKSSEHGLIVHNCPYPIIFYCSIAYSNIDRNSEILKCKENVSGSNFMVLMTNFRGIVSVSNSNFTDGCGNSQYGGIVVQAVSSKSVDFTIVGIEVVQKLQNSGDGFVIFSNRTSISLNLSNSKLKGTADNSAQRNHARGLWINTIHSPDKATIYRITIDGSSFIDISGCQICTKFYGGVTSYLHVIVKNTVFSHKQVSSPGHQYAIHIFINQTASSVEDTFELQNVTLSLNNAFEVGLFFEVITSEKLNPGFITIKDSLFSSNKNMNSAVRLSVEKLVNITNCVFLDNSGGSAISVSTTDRLVLSNVTFTNNSMTAVEVWNGVVQFNGRNKIQNNQATGIFLQGSSYIKVDDNSELILLNNTGGTVGGAIHVNDMRTFQNYYCSILVSNDSQIIFSGNRAVEGGGDVYGARLVDCLDIDDNHVPRQGQPNETSWYFNIPQSHRMNYSNTDLLSSISSDPIMVCFCENKIPNCSKRFLSHEGLFPGEVAKTEIATVGNYGGTSSGTVSIAVHNASLVRPYGPQGSTARCHKLHLLLNSFGPTSASVAITVNGGLPGWGVTLAVDIMECPPGFIKNEQSGKCECAPLLKNFSISCIASHNASYFSRSGSNWFAFLNTTNRTCLTVFTDCPFDYCNSSQVTFNILDPDDQCTGGREGILCGQCQPGLSLLLGSNRCASCSNVYLLLVLVFAVAGIVLVGVIMALNLTVSVGAVNGLLLYANMVKLNESVFSPNGRPPVVSQFISWLNLDFGIELCLIDGLDGYWKTWLQFIFPSYLFLLMGAIILGSHYSAKICRLCGSNAVPALATLFLMSYTKILQTVTNALTMSQLNCNGTLLKVWSVDGNIDYFSVQHLILVIFSGCVLIVGVAYPLLVLFAPLLERYSDKCIPSNWNPVSKMKPLLDAYGGPYKDRHRYWTGVTLLVRLLVTIVFSFTSGRLVFLNGVIIAVLVQGFFFTWSFTKGVYRSITLNILDSMFLLNLFVLAISSLLFLYLKLKTAQEVTTIVSISLSLLGFLAIVVECVWLRIKRKWLRTVKPNRLTSLQGVDQLISSSDNDRAGSPIKRSVSPPSHVYGTIRGEHQFDLHLPDNSRNINSPSSSAVLREREPLLFSTSAQY